MAALTVFVCAGQRPIYAQSAPATPAPGDDSAPVQAPATQQTLTPAQTPAATPPPPGPTEQSGQSGLPDAPKPATPKTATTKPAATDPASQFAATVCTKLPCPTPIINWYMRFENGPQVKPLTPKEKAWLATKNLIDPFNMLTVLGEAGISVAADSHSPYGPGFPGWGRNVGVSFTQDMTGEFFHTFLIPSIVHQDPHYHRMPKASYRRRIFHAIDQIVWTQGDNGKGMLNYADLVGFGIDDEISNLYVPGRETNGSATAERYAIALATAPIDNFITEFLPDVARHVHVQVVIIQRVIDEVATKDSGGS
ncbi:hypothetical protein [Acidicapsa acidisoli]|uniref:hypothetical protein n=1 Tax=Acidicapsa acidisoli TaxID=1615681 RepID=UPI0021DF4C7E|nr:hypothetical protein [Acidicapsa acidisoli]